MKTRHPTPDEIQQAADTFMESHLGVVGALADNLSFQQRPSDVANLERLRAEWIAEFAKTEIEVPDDEEVHPDGRGERPE